MAHSSTFRPDAVLPAIQMWSCCRVWKLAFTSNRGGSVADAPAARASAKEIPMARTITLSCGSCHGKATELDRLNPQDFRKLRLVVPNLTNHRLGCLTLEVELDHLLGVSTDDAVEEHAASG
jgi:hypothetical protein